RNNQELPARSRPSPPSRSCLAHPQRKRSRVPTRRRFRHSAPRLSSISDAWGRLNVVTPFHHLSGDSHLHRSLGAGPITASRLFKRGVVGRYERVVDRIFWTRAGSDIEQGRYSSSTDAKCRGANSRRLAPSGPPTSEEVHRRLLS